MLVSLIFPFKKEPESIQKGDIVMCGRVGANGEAQGPKSYLSKVVLFTFIGSQLPTTHIYPHAPYPPSLFITTVSPYSKICQK